MIQNDLFRQCLAAVPEDQKAEFELSFGIAERISEVLKSKNLTQKDFAQKLHKRESEISKWMTGRHNFTMQTIAKIETALGCKLINIAKWYLQTKGKENLSSPCFFVCADYPNTPSVRLTAWIFLLRLTLTSSSSSLQGIDWASSSLLLLRSSVGIHLRRGHAAMTQHFLHRRDVCSSRNGKGAFVWRLLW